MPQAKQKLRVFICYTKRDIKKARKIFDRLKQLGMDPWLDEKEMLIGDEYIPKIKSAVRKADAFVVLLRPEFDDAGFRQLEVRWALDEQRLRPSGRSFIFPFLVEPCKNLPEWCREIHAGDITKPTEINDLLFALENHFRFLIRTENTQTLSSKSSFPTAIACISTSVDIPAEIQQSAIQRYVEAEELEVVNTIYEPEPFGSMRKFLERQNVAAVVIYRFDCLAKETLNNLGLIGEFFSETKLALRSVTERVAFVGGYRHTGPTITSLIDQSHLFERLEHIQTLEKLFSSPVRGVDGQGCKCGNLACGSAIGVCDQVNGGGGVDYYAPLYSCKKCGWYEIGGEYWTTDY